MRVDALFKGLGLCVPDKILNIRNRQTTLRVVCL